jgi:hypothetical protein
MMTLLQLLLLTSIPTLIQSFGSTIQRISRSSTASTRIYAKSYPFEGKPSLFSSKTKRSRNFQFRKSLHSTKNLDGNLLQPVLGLNGFLCILVSLWYAASSTVTSKSSAAITSVNELVFKINILTKNLIPRVNNNNNNNNNKHLVKKKSDSLSTRISNMIEFLRQASDASDLDIKASTYTSFSSTREIEYDQRSDEKVYSKDEDLSSIDTVAPVEFTDSVSEIITEAPIVKKSVVKASMPVSQALVNATLEIQGTFKSRFYLQ